MSKIIVNWLDINRAVRYVVFPVHTKTDGEPYLGEPQEMLMGWQVVATLREGEYAALEVPALDADAVRLIEEFRW